MLLNYMKYHQPLGIVYPSWNLWSHNLRLNRNLRECQSLRQCSLPERCLRIQSTNTETPPGLVPSFQKIRPLNMSRTHKRQKPWNTGFELCGKHSTTSHNSTYHQSFSRGTNFFKPICKPNGPIRVECMSQEGHVANPEIGTCWYRDLTGVNYILPRTSMAPARKPSQKERNIS